MMKRYVTETRVDPYAYDPDKAKKVDEQRKAQEQRAERVDVRAKDLAVRFGVDLGVATKASMAMEDGKTENEALLEFGLAGAKARRKGV